MIKKVDSDDVQFCSDAGRFMKLGCFEDRPLSQDEKSAMKATREKNECEWDEEKRSIYHAFAAIFKVGAIDFARKRFVEVIPYHIHYERWTTLGSYVPSYFLNLEQLLNVDDDIDTDEIIHTWSIGHSCDPKPLKNGKSAFIIVNGKHYIGLNSLYQMIVTFLSSNNLNKVNDFDFVELWDSLFNEYLEMFHQQHIKLLDENSLLHQ